MLYELLKSKRLIVRSNSLNSYMVFLKLGNLESLKKKGKKESNSIVLAYIADVSVSTNPSYMRTSSLMDTILYEL